jgi:hypothetical protein
MATLEKKLDLEFLKKLENELHSFEPIESKVYGKGCVDKFSKRKLTDEEMNLILMTTKDDPNLIFTPTQGNFGFRPAYRIYQTGDPIAPGIPIEIFHILSFEGDQLPPGWNFQRLSEYFDSPENLKKIDYVNSPQLERPREERDYNY